MSWKVLTFQSFVTLSTIELEYMTLTEAAKERIWVRGLFSDLGLHHVQANVFCDRLSVIFLAKNHVHHERTKCIDVRYYFLRDEKSILVKKVETTNNLTYMFTKPVPHNKFKNFLELLNVSKC